ncbi:hypothetical protein SAMN04487894_107184 [Niabella drilacis]|uniref:Uncharacterized protein n=2 Tax=Niabella drilacis (strain DSM 25811 / CCM 8410 / CCUG 62505 / LMG 26954 / E90) TaxID=1285928 RepID=A0A1G6TG33_NIADE|nr:hypothetical protein SAMN04487894_107184 [Niabella drilacis]
MKTKKIIGLVMLIVIGGLVLLTFVLYSTIKTKSTDISKYAPYNNWIGKTVTLDKQTVLVMEKARLNGDKSYPYLLLDSLHPDWQYLEEREKNGDYTKVVVFPAGLKLHIKKAIQFTGGVSGNSTPMIFGTLFHNGKEYKTGYQWGQRQIARYMDKIKECWHFHRAPWQTRPDTVFYALPDAQWW